MLCIQTKWLRPELSTPHLSSGSPWSVQLPSDPAYVKPSKLASWLHTFLDSTYGIMSWLARPSPLCLGASPGSQFPHWPGALSLAVSFLRRCWAGWNPGPRSGSWLCTYSRFTVEQTPLCLVLIKPHNEPVSRTPGSPSRFCMYYNFHFAYEKIKVWSGESLVQGHIAQKW